MDAPVLVFSQSTGIVREPGGAFVALGWSGNGEGKGNPAMQSVRSVGPLPQGLYRVGPWHDHPRLGPLVAELHQVEGETFGRDDFFCHGPSTNPARKGQESRGCIVVPRAGRVKVAELAPEGSLVQVVA